MIFERCHLEENFMYIQKKKKKFKTRTTGTMRGRHILLQKNKNYMEYTAVEEEHNGGFEKGY